MPCSCVDVEMGSYTAQIELVPPEWGRREDERGICVDACLALEVSSLWALGIQTTGCCCGHNIALPYIGVVPAHVEKMKAFGYVVRANPTRPSDEDSFVPARLASKPEGTDRFPDQRSDDDCLVCCLAVLTGAAYDDIPQFVRDHGSMWAEAMREWLSGRGLEVVAFDNHYPRAGVYMADGWTDRETCHMTVWRGVEMIHDPHESRAGLTNIRRTYWVMPLALIDAQPKDQPHAR